MRIIESILCIALLVIGIRLVARNGKREKIVESAVIILLAAASMVIEGVRFAMIPLYIVSALVVGMGLLTSFVTFKRKHKVMKWLGVGIMGLLYMSGVSLAIFMGVINLPVPSGPQLVGTTIMDFTNHSRPDLLTNGTKAERIAVQVWYPAASHEGDGRVNWMSSKEMASLFAKEKGMPDVFGQLALVKTNSYKNAPIAEASHGYPIVLFSGGAGMFSGQNVVQMEELASHGYVVFAVSHPGDDFATVYEDGTILGSDVAGREALGKDTSSAIATAQKAFPEEEGPAFQHAVIKNAKLYNRQAQVWAEDLCFVADQIMKVNAGEVESIFEGRLDVNEIGLFGHSFGGAAVGQACLMDSRFKAFINMDGTPFGETENQVIDQPFMILTSDSQDPKSMKICEGYATDQKNYVNQSIKGSEHINFTDLNTILPHIGKALGVLGPIDAAEQTKLMNGYILGFFDQHLKQ